MSEYFSGLFVSVVPSYFDRTSVILKLCCDFVILPIQLCYLIHAYSGLVIPWTEAVPGITVNFTSESEVRRRKMPETFKTGGRLVFWLV